MTETTTPALPAWLPPVGSFIYADRDLWRVIRITDTRIYLAAVGKTADTFIGTHFSVTGSVHNKDGGHIPPYVSRPSNEVSAREWFIRLSATTAEEALAALGRARAALLPISLQIADLAERIHELARQERDLMRAVLRGEAP